MNATAIVNIVLSMNISKSKSKNKEAHALDLLSQVVIEAETARGKVIKLSVESNKELVLLEHLLVIQTLLLLVNQQGT